MSPTTTCRRCVSASRALAELKGAGRLIPNQSILINAIPLQEAGLSSEIENIVTTQDELFRAAIEDPRRVDPQTKEVLRCRTALRRGYDMVQTGPLNVDLVLEVCETLLGETVDLRDAQTIIVEDVAAGSVIYTPPRGRALIVPLLENLTSYIGQTDGPDPLIRMAVAHYQFEAIHPFHDGNGRTGRILNILALLQAGLLEIPVLYLSRYIIQNRQEYYRRLRAVTEQQEWEGWLLTMLTAVQETARWTSGRVTAIRELLEATAERCRKELPRIYSKELIELVFHQPYCKIAFLVDAGLAERKTASRYLRELERVGILASEKRGREVIYKHPALLEVLKA